MKNTTKNTFLRPSQAFKMHNDGQNQEIKRQFVAREIFCNVGSMVEYCLKHGFEDTESPVSFDSIENYYRVNTEALIDTIIADWDDNQEEFTAYANDPDTYNRKVKKEGDFRIFLISLDESEMEEFCHKFNYEPETEPQEIFEWWAVSSGLFDDLKAHGCPVVDTGSVHVWGRCTTGQAIILDGVIGRICAEMEILEGQSNSWAKK